MGSSLSILIRVIIILVAVSNSPALEDCVGVVLLTISNR